MCKEETQYRLFLRLRGWLHEMYEWNVFLWEISRVGFSIAKVNSTFIFSNMDQSLTINIFSFAGDMLSGMSIQLLFVKCQRMRDSPKVQI